MLYFDPQTRRGVVHASLSKTRATLGVVCVNNSGSYGRPLYVVRCDGDELRDVSVRTFGRTGPKVYVFECRERIARLLRKMFPQGIAGRPIRAEYCSGLTPEERRERREKLRAQAPQFS